MLAVAQYEDSEAAARELHARECAEMRRAEGRGATCQTEARGAATPAIEEEEKSGEGARAAAALAVGVGGVGGGWFR